MTGECGLRINRGADDPGRTAIDQNNCTAACRTNICGDSLIDRQGPFEDGLRLLRRAALFFKHAQRVQVAGVLVAVFAQGVGDGLQVTGQVTSPTFVIARVHRSPIFH